MSLNHSLDPHTHTHSPTQFFFFTQMMSLVHTHTMITPAHTHTHTRTHRLLTHSLTLRLSLYDDSTRSLTHSHLMATGKVKVQDEYWIRADPVHLHIEHDQILLADSRVFRISSQEADQLTELLNQHFAANGQEMVFLPLWPDRWYVRAAKIPPAKTHLLGEVANKSINELLPFGKNAGLWRGLFNEIQMLLHEHPLNQLREARGEPAINSVWFWGGGSMPIPIVSHYTHVWSNHMLAGSLAAAERCRLRTASGGCLSLPPMYHVWQPACRTGCVVWKSPIRRRLWLA